MTAASPTTYASPTISAALTGLDDAHLATWLKQLKSERKDVVLVHAGTTCKVYEKSAIRPVLQPVDPEGEAKKVFKALAKLHKLFTVEITQEEISNATVADKSWLPHEKSAHDIDVFLELRKARLGRVEGRGEAITLETANTVWSHAGGCCMFKGCCIDLSTVPLYNRGARIAYLAHIIASDPDGPRGTPEKSHLLSNNPENIMLMCDAHHRLIDSFEPDAYKAPRLQGMRQEHTDMVRKYRDALRFPVAQVVTLFADLGNVPTHFPDSDFLGALLEENLSMLGDVKRHLPYQHRDDRTPPNFWTNYLWGMEPEIRHMVQDLRKQTSAAVLAVFPLHHSPTLVLAGRIIGEARPVKVFQRSRQRKSWQWNTEGAALPAGTFKALGELEVEADEVLLTVELTAYIDEHTLPTDIAQALNTGSIPWIRLTTDTPSGECLQREEDLAQFVNVARQTINAIQDKVRAKRVHLIAICPVSAAFSIGQLMQAGNHSVFTLYDRPNGQQPFREAFTIQGTSVVPPAGSIQHPISIQ